MRKSIIAWYLLTKELAECTDAKCEEAHRCHRCQSVINARVHLPKPNDEQMELLDAEYRQ